MCSAKKAQAAQTTQTAQAAQIKNMLTQTGQTEMALSHQTVNLNHMRVSVVRPVSGFFRSNLM